MASESVPPARSSPHDRILGRWVRRDNRIKRKTLTSLSARREPPCAPGSIAASVQGPIKHSVVITESHESQNTSTALNNRAPTAIARAFTGPPIIPTIVLEARICPANLSYRTPKPTIRSGARPSTGYVPGRSCARTAPAVPTHQSEPAEQDGPLSNQRTVAECIDCADEQGNREQFFESPAARNGDAFANPDPLAEKPAELGTLEHVFARGYLYARYSVLNPKRARRKSCGRTHIYRNLVGAVSKNASLPLGQSVLLGLDHLHLTSKRFGPTLAVALLVPGRDEKPRDRQLRMLSQGVLNEYCGRRAERESGRRVKPR